MNFIILFFSVFNFTLILKSILCKNDSNEIIFQNNFVTYYEDYFVIHYYYFPYGDKMIHYKNIRSCRLLEENNLSFFQIKSWGMAFSSIWWPLDMQRTWRNYFIVIDAKQWPKIGLTMDDQQTLIVYKLIQQKLRQ